ncbi:MAG: hypothetical protein KJO41_06100 [Bacteroidia bacterium]|nr:hypothetical protein [Bacteroidia bacterium]NND25024.1 hypothetical protein [Flavobacteriaceae bacterium]MBT8278556.1 hypothetical protein [Bacteroidia bacterium]NNK59550.1 hypothetical protein [Flavobacteriaceae bacterium]NNL32485.1 hypothetical protein [Flavobacteriaceae bacterium]
MTTRFKVGLLFLAIQVGLIVYARFIPERFFCWAPYDIHSKYEIQTTINGKLLSSTEAEQRYNYKSKGWEQRSIYNIISLVAQYERTYGANDNAQVEIIFAVNGNPEEKWTLKP